MFCEVAPQNKIFLLQPQLRLSLKDGKCLQQNWAWSTPGVLEIASGLWEFSSEIQTHMEQTHSSLDICPVIKLYEQHYVCSVKLDDTLRFWQSLGLLSFSNANSNFQVENYISDDENPNQTSNSAETPSQFQCEPACSFYHLGYF